METRRERLYRIGGRAEARYQRRKARVSHPWTRFHLLREADALVARLVRERLAEPAEYRPAAPHRP